MIFTAPNLVTEKKKSFDGCIYYFLLTQIIIVIIETIIIVENETNYFQEIIFRVKRLECKWSKMNELMKNDTKDV